MIPGMRLYQHRETWYIYHNGKRKSLKTKDKRIAKGIFRDLQNEYLHREARKINQDTAVKLSEFRDFYNKAADRQDLSQHTPLSVTTSFNSLIQHIGDIPISSITKDVIDRYKVDAQEHLKPSSINTYLINIQAALSYAVDQGILAEAIKIKHIKTGKRQRRVIMPDDLEKIIACSPSDLQRAIQLSLWTGARLSEVANMRYEHKQGQSVRIIGKGDKERIVPLVGKAKEILNQQDIGPVFAWKASRSLSRAFYRACVRAGVKARFHDLRHTAATQMLAKGVMLSVVQRILGHSHVATTQIYADVLEETLMKEMKKMEDI